MNLTQALQSLQQLLQSNDFPGLASLAAQVTKTHPQNAAALRYLGIANLFNGKGGDRYLLRAALLNDDEAPLWLGVLANSPATRRAACCQPILFSRSTW